MFTDDFQHITDQIDIDENGRVLFAGQPFVGREMPGADAETVLFHHLTDLLYSAFYTRRQTDSASAAYTEDTEFLAGLRQANHSTERFDSHWQVEEIEHTGNMLVRKGGYKRYTGAGEFLRDRFGPGPVRQGETVNIRVWPDTGETHYTADAFHFVFGETQLENNNSAIVRLYFNIKPDGAAWLISQLTEKLNSYRVPFQFKCLNRPALYTRSDAAVLYVDKRYFHVTAELLHEFYPGLQQWLKPEAPMFTRLIAPGIGFAENPFAADESFGVNRCRIIAAGIAGAWKNHLPKTAWITAVLENIRHNHLIPEALYLNPRSVYPYRFPSFNPA